LKIFIRILLIIILLASGFAAGVPVGQSIGFSTGSEWALVQAELLAREAGLAMPVSLRDGEFLVVIKHPRHLYKHAWKLADLHEKEMARVGQGKRDLSETIELARNTFPPQ